MLELIKSQAYFYEKDTNGALMVCTHYIFTWFNADDITIRKSKSIAVYFERPSKKNKYGFTYMGISNLWKEFYLMKELQ